MVFWFWSALIIFSWAGEKMPWLVVHMALPGNLLAAWVLSRLLRLAATVQFARGLGTLLRSGITLVEALRTVEQLHRNRFVSAKVGAARNAVLADGADFTALDLIGYAYFSRGDWVSGLRFLLRALDANPGYAPARLHLGMLYLAREDLAAARQQLELAVELAPGSPAAVQAQEILERFLP